MGLAQFSLHAILSSFVEMVRVGEAMRALQYAV